MESSNPAPASRRRRRLWFVLGGAAALAIVIFAAGPLILAAVARSRIKAEASRQLDADVTLRGLRVSWGGKVKAGRLKIVPRGFTRPLLESEQLKADVSLGQLLRGRTIVRAEIVRPRIILEKDAAGTPNLKPRPESKPREKRDKKEDGVADLTIRVVEPSFLVDRGGGERPVEGSCRSVDAHLRLNGGRVEGLVSVDVNGGRVELKPALDFRPASFSPSSSLQVNVDRVGAGAGMGPLLEKIHPVFHTAGGRIEGELNAAFQLSWQGPLEPGGSWLAAATRSLSGRGNLSAARLSVTGSPAASAILQALGEGGALEGELSARDIQVGGGACRYSDLSLRAGRHSLRFSGAVGFDRSLDLRVDLGRKHSVPLGGTIDRPRLELNLKEKAKDLLEDFLDRKKKAK